VVEVMRVAGDAIARRLGEAVDRQLGKGRRRHRHHAGSTDARDELGVGRSRLRVRSAAVSGDVPGDVEVVLDGDRHPEQRPVVALGAAVVGLGRGVEGGIGEELHHGIEPRVLTFDGREGGHGEIPGTEGS
jgi:hypothetical protein